MRKAATIASIVDDLDEQTYGSGPFPDLPHGVDVRYVEGYAGAYAVDSVTGSIYTRRSSRLGPFGIWRRLKPTMDRKGYERVSLWQGGRRSVKRIATIVAAVFIGKRPSGMHVAHQDGNKRRNALANLAYRTPVQNEAEKLLHGTTAFGEKNPSARMTNSLAYIMRFAVKFGLYTQAELSRMSGIPKKTIGDAVRGITWPHVESP
jgi:hypothetical protein